MLPLCHRCEHRVCFLESGHGPRCECHQEGAVNSCYMYRPVLPLVLKPNKGEDRPLGAAWAFAGRGHSEKHLDAELVYVEQDGVGMYWRPCENAEE
jgi:hypothetical protein